MEMNDVWMVLIGGALGFFGGGALVYLVQLVMLHLEKGTGSYKVARRFVENNHFLKQELGELGKLISVPLPLRLFLMRSQVVQFYFRPRNLRKVVIMIQLDPQGMGAEDWGIYRAHFKRMGKVVPIPNN